VSQMTRVVVTGATGTIGQAICHALTKRGDQVLALSRNPTRARSVLGTQVEVREWSDPIGVPPPGDALSGTGGVIHLMGEPVAQRWNETTKERIHDSRVLSTRMLVDAVHALPDTDRPLALISQSASGYYGPSDERELDEDAPAGSDFLATVVRDWETEARRADDVTRVVMTRTGVALTPAGGALAQMLPFFRAGVGGPVAGGRQYVPWVHLADVVAAVLFCLDQPRLRGPVNVGAPRPATNAELSHALGRVLHRPAVLPVPALALRLLYGEMASIVTTGQRVIPRRLSEAGFVFAHPELESALRDVLEK